MITTHDSIFSLPTNQKPCNIHASKQARKKERFGGEEEGNKSRIGNRKKERRA
jgi:hypothetical protein